MKHVATIGSAVFALVAASAFAQNPPPAATPAPAAAKAPIEFASLDANKDGKVSMAEGQVNADLRAEFGKLDTNRDDSLSATEFAQWSHAGKGKDASKTYSESDSPAEGAISEPKRETL